MKKPNLNVDLKKRLSGLGKKSTDKPKTEKPKKQGGQRRKLIRKKAKPVYEEELDTLGIIQAVEQFNDWKAPARIFYNRNSHAVYVFTYPMGSDKHFGDQMVNGLDIVELYRKTSAGCDQKVTPEAIEIMVKEIPPYWVW